MERGILVHSEVMSEGAENPLLGDGRLSLDGVILRKKDNLPTSDQLVTRSRSGQVGSFQTVQMFGKVCLNVEKV